MKKNWPEIEYHWNRLISHELFDMAIPCIVIDQNCEVIETNISGLSNHLKVSMAMSSSLVNKYSQLSLQNGSEKAMKQMLISHINEIDELRLMLVEAKKDIENGAIATIDDLVDAISTAKKDFTKIHDEYLLFKSIKMIAIFCLFVSLNSKSYLSVIEICNDMMIHESNSLMTKMMRFECY